MTINLAALDTAAASEAPYDLELISPFDSKPTGLFIQVLGHNSEAVRTTLKQQAEAGRVREFEERRTGKPQMTTAEEEETSALDTAVAGTVGWYERKRGKSGELGKREDGLPFGDTRITFGKDEARKLYANPGLAWMGGQVVKAMFDLGNFTRR